MTEFLVFLALCAGFSYLFWRFLRTPTKEQRIKAEVARQLEGDRASVRAKDLASRARQTIPVDNSPNRGNRFASGPASLQSVLKHDIKDYDGPFPDQPFGYDILKAKSRTIPNAYRGRWIEESLTKDRNPSTYPYRSVIELRDTELVISGAVQPVVAVETGEENALPESVEPEIAVVSEAEEENGNWLFSLSYFGLIDNGNVLVDVESTDTRWVRA